MSTTTPAPREARGPRVLVVDDEPAIRHAIGRFLESKGFAVVRADSADAALEELHTARFAVMLCDIRMPGTSGLAALPRALAIQPDLAVLMLTAVNDAPTAADALAQGAMGYLVKPVELPDLLEAIDGALRKRELLQHQRRFDQLLREEVAERTAELEREKQALRELSVQVVHALINAMNARDEWHRGRSERVAALAATIAAEMGLPDDTVEAVRVAGRLADVGMIGVPESILGKPGPLTPEEYERVKDHVRVSMEILAPLTHLAESLQYIQDHHERWDGSGYPRGLAGEAISIGGRILAAADAFDALTSGRAYKDALSPMATVEYLSGKCGQLLDPAVFDALQRAVRRRKSLTFIHAIPA